MRLTKAEESKLITEGILAILLCLALAGGVFWGTASQVKKIVNDADSVKISNATVLESNRKEAREIRFLRDNAQTIEAMWSTLKGWGDGVKPNNIAPLTEAGLENHTALPSTKVPGNPTSYAGLRVNGDKTEFQRMLVGLAAVEANQGLLQVRKAEMTLPPNTPPNGGKPTFLQMQLEIVAPSTK